MQKSFSDGLRQRMYLVGQLSEFSLCTISSKWKRKDHYGIVLIFKQQTTNPEDDLQFCFRFACFEGQFIIDQKLHVLEEPNDEQCINMHQAPLQTKEMFTILVDYLIVRSNLLGRLKGVYFNEGFLPLGSEDGSFVNNSSVILRFESEYAFDIGFLQSDRTFIRMGIYYKALDGTYKVRPDIIPSLDQLFAKEGERRNPLIKQRKEEARNQSEKEQDQEIANSCAVCFGDISIPVAIVPCGHRDICHLCLEQIDICHLCRQPILLKMQLH